MLGHKLVQTIGKDHQVTATIRKRDLDFDKSLLFDDVNIIGNIDVSSEVSVDSVIVENEPDVVINAVGVIKQLPSSKDVIKTLTINSIFPNRLAEMAVNYGFKLITISTDCVFTGEKGNYNELDEPDAKDLYGKSKNFGEVTGKNCLTLRTSIIGRELFTKHSLVEWFLSNKNGKAKGYKNAIYSGFPTCIMAEIILNVIECFPKLEGLYHVSSEPINKFELLKLINDRYQANVQIESFDDFFINRSLNSDKFRSETNFTPLDWEKMVDIMAQDPTPYEKFRI